MKKEEMRIAKILGGGAVGGFLGKSVGIAALGTGFSGMLPLAIVGMIIVAAVTKDNKDQDG